jgi:hypothetical protein
MAKTKKSMDLLNGLNAVPKAVGLMAKKSGVFYSETPQVKGRVARALAKETKGGSGKVSERSTYKHMMKKGFREQTRQERGKVVRALAKNTKGGKGLISKRPAYKKHVPARK